MNRPLNQNEMALAGILNIHRNHIIALSAILKALPKESIKREDVRKNLNTLPLFDGVAQKYPEVKAEVEKIVDQILGPA